MDRWDQDQLVPEWWEEKSMEKERNAHDPKHTTSSVKHGGGSVMAWACMAASGTGSLVFYWWCDCWQKQQDEFWSVSGNIICSYSAKCFRTHWTALHSADGQWPKAYCKSNQRVFEGKEVDCYAMAKSITWPESDWACISLAEDKTEGKMPKNKQELKTVAVEAWQSITRDETQRLVMSMRSRLQAVIDCKGLQPSIKKWKFDLWLLFCPITFGPLTSGRHICKLL